MQRNVTRILARPNTRPQKPIPDAIIKRRFYASSSETKIASKDAQSRARFKAFVLGEPVDVETLGYLRMQDLHAMQQVRRHLKTLNTEIDRLAGDVAKIPSTIPLPGRDKDDATGPVYTNAALREHVDGDVPLALADAKTAIDYLDKHLRDLLGEQFTTLSEATIALGSEGRPPGVPGAQGPKWQLDFEKEIEGLTEAQQRTLLRDLQYEEESKVQQLQRQSETIMGYAQTMKAIAAEANPQAFLALERRIPARGQWRGVSIATSGRSAVKRGRAAAAAAAVASQRTMRPRFSAAEAAPQGREEGVQTSSNETTASTQETENKPSTSSGEKGEPPNKAAAEPTLNLGQIQDRLRNALRWKT